MFSITCDKYLKVPNQELGYARQKICNKKQKCSNCNQYVSWLYQSCKYNDELLFCSTCFPTGDNKHECNQETC